MGALLSRLLVDTLKKFQLYITHKDKKCWQRKKPQWHQANKKELSLYPQTNFHLRFDSYVSLVYISSLNSQKKPSHKIFAGMFDSITAQTSLDFLLCQLLISISTGKISRLDFLHHNICSTAKKDASTDSEPNLLVLSLA